jgi:hypothetical protein
MMEGFTQALGKIHEIKNRTNQRIKYHNKLLKQALKCNDSENLIYHHAAIDTLNWEKQVIDVILKK